jgi:hypothetical protein
MIIIANPQPITSATGYCLAFHPSEVAPEFSV